MHIILALFLVIPFLLNASHPERARALLSGFDALVEKALADFQVPGVAIAIVVDGEVVLAKGYGERDLERHLPVTADTLFPIGSCTKAFTAVALGTLIDQGLCDWDSKIVDILPEFRLHSSYATLNMTFRDLLAHRSGLSRHDYLWYNSAFSSHELLARLRYLEPASELRERFHYNNLMFLVAGMAMEKITGKSYEEIVKTAILEPLKMTRTTFSQNELKRSSDAALPYLETKQGIKKIPYRNTSLIAPGSAINSSVNELSRWIQFQLAQGVWKGKSLVHPTTFKETHLPQVVASAYPECEGAQIYAYGLGWALQTYRGHQNLSHDGVADGFTAVVSLLPEERVGLVVLCNQNLSVLPRGLSVVLLDLLLELPSRDCLAEGLERIAKNKEGLRNKTEDLSRKQGTHPSHPLTDYVGNYVHPGYGAAFITLGKDHLEATFNNITYQLEHWHYDTFFVTSQSEATIVPREGLKFTFHNHPDGEIDELSVPFEAHVHDIVFKRTKDAGQHSFAYLNQFVGNYEIYSYVVEIAFRNHKLCAIIPGQPVYELVPEGESEFTVKELLGYRVRFLLTPHKAVEEVQLIPPYGLAYSAKPRKSE